MSTLTTTQASALVELQVRGSLHPSSRSFDKIGRRTFSRRTLQALVDAGHAKWATSVRGTRNGPVTYDGFIVPVEREEVFVLRDSSPESYGWWIYCATADAWMCFGIEDDGVCHDADLIAEWSQATRLGSCYVGFDEGAARIVAEFGIVADEKVTTEELQALIGPPVNPPTPAKEEIDMPRTETPERAAQLDAMGWTKIEPTPKPTTTSFRTGYMDFAVYNLEAVVDEAKRRLEGHLDEFDTIVGTGFSGGVVIPALAMALGKHYVLIRKETDDSHHGPGRLLGVLGQRWIFVDDFVSSGRTKDRVLDKIAAACVVNDHETTYVGDYLYVHAPGSGEPGFVGVGS